MLVAEEEGIIHTFLQQMQMTVGSEVYIGDIGDSGVEPEEYTADWASHACIDQCMDHGAMDNANNGLASHGLIHCDERIEKGASVLVEKGRRVHKRRGGKNVKQASQCLRLCDDEGQKDTTFHVYASTPELRLRNTGVG